MLRSLPAIILGLAALLVIINLQDYLISPELQPVSTRQDEIDYYMTNFSFSAINAAGETSMNLRGQYQAHWRERKTSFIIEPRLDSHRYQTDAPEDTVSLSASEAVLDHRDNIAALQGEVHLLARTRGETRLDLTTTELQYDINNNIISTTEAVLLKSPGFVLQGTGLTAKLDQESLRINNNVRSTYIPAH
ncbi:MAG TPA: LPS export ABC transporter periplasmic protein LptC [Thiolinea sp.]|nr:LPS export ABC transporter periplasmic protein LptC [Thiolinea sp.]